MVGLDNYVTLFADPLFRTALRNVGLLVLLQAGAGMIWGGNPRSFPPAFSIKGYRVGDHSVLFSPSDLFTVLIVAVLMVALTLLFRRTNLGLQMRAAAFEPEVSRLLGVRVVGDVMLDANLRLTSRRACPARRWSRAPRAAAAAPSPRVR